MLAKITRENQVTIPKEIMKRAHLMEASPYVQVDYLEGIILLKPVEVEERIPPEQLEKLAERSLLREKEDLHFGSLEKGIEHFRKRIKKKEL